MPQPVFERRQLAEEHKCGGRKSCAGAPPEMVELARFGPPGSRSPTDVAKEGCCGSCGAAMCNHHEAAAVASMLGEWMSAGASVGYQALDSVADVRAATVLASPTTGAAGSGDIQR